MSYWEEVQSQTWDMMERLYLLLAWEFLSAPSNVLEEIAGERPSKTDLDRLYKKLISYFLKVFL